MDNGWGKDANLSGYTSARYSYSRGYLGHTKVYLEESRSGLDYQTDRYTYIYDHAVEFQANQISLMGTTYHNSDKKNRRTRDLMTRALTQPVKQKTKGREQSKQIYIADMQLTLGTKQLSTFHLTHPLKGATVKLQFS